MSEEQIQIEKQVPSAQKPQRKPAAPRTSKRVATKKKKEVNAVTLTSKRKEAVARVSIKEGKGTIRFNGFEISTVEPRFVRETILEPLHVSTLTAGMDKSFDIEINVRGGGMMGQMQAARTGVAKALVKYAGSEALKNEYMRYDRSLLVDDPRRVEPKKFKGPKARARFQKSYR